MFAQSLLLLAALAQHILAISPIEVLGSKLFVDGQQWYNKGIAYQLDTNDPLANTEQCTLDAALMKTLGANSIRVYHVDATLDHSGCMSAFADAGIYAWIDLDTFSTYIYSGTTAQWNETGYDAYTAVMDAFQGYDNVAGFFVGNEMLTDGESSVAAPFIKAAARDMKAYRDKKGYRSIPIGYSAADVAILRPNLQNYLACGDSAEAVDFYSLNVYEWCGDSSYDVSGYDILEQNASAYNIPIFFSEDGCNTPEPRLFTDQTAILGSEMDSTWSGAIIYEWIEVTNNYGLVSYGPPAASAAATASNVVDGYTVSGTPTPISPDFPNLSSQWATLSPSGIAMSAYTPSNSPPACPAYTSGAWEVSGDVALPTIGDSLTGTSYSATAAATTTASSSGSAASASASASSTASSKAAAAARPTAAAVFTHVKTITASRPGHESLLAKVFGKDHLRSIWSYVLYVSVCACITALLV